MDTLGIVESKSIAAGVELADAMMKAASVKLVRASTICSGRYLIYISGDREAVATGVRVAEESGRKLMGSYVISQISPDVMAVLRKDVPIEQVQSMGIIECRNVSSGIVAADAVVKRTDVQLARLVSGQGINGKSYFVMSGDVASVEEAAEAARSVLGKNLVEAVVIPRPDASVVRALIKEVR
ncbi:BMC domain-containing protein [Maridesulfovibrio zosterae]|uniref:BMC domain-containing protein n=1 Tax=Maridesulfovibrio zosterae TaxID=82171 RepID=UPI000400487B|nr:BMC domain-containing protein [Maridesulfovibrio zosterae]